MTAVIPMKRIEKAVTRTVRTLLVFVIVVAPIFPDCPQEPLLGSEFRERCREFRQAAKLSKIIRTAKNQCQSASSVAVTNCALPAGPVRPSAGGWHQRRKGFRRRSGRPPAFRKDLSSCGLFGTDGFG